MFKKNVENEHTLQAESFVGKGFSVIGVIKGKGNLQLDGCVEGDVVTEGDVFVSQDGEVKGMIEANNITIAGSVAGDVYARGNLLIQETGILTGDVKTETITIETNGTFLGKSKMNLPEGKEGRSKDNSVAEEPEDEEKKTVSVFRNLSHLEEMCRKSIRGLGITRYRAFEDTGGDLSFSIALVDGYKDGVVISSIYSKDDCRVFAKPVVQGESEYELSAEENQVLDIALQDASI